MFSLTKGDAEGRGIKFKTKNSRNYFKISTIFFVCSSTSLKYWIWIFSPEVRTISKVPK
jgi:hypothetical protein